MRKQTIICCIIATISCKQDETTKTSTIRDVDSFFPDKKTEVLVVGTFHFNYPGLDGHKTDDTDKIDVLKEPRKSEVLELAEYIKRFKPNKIALEARSSWDATGKLRQYKAGERTLGRDERDQLGIRIASELGLDTIYSIDAESFTNDLHERMESFSNELWKDYDWESDDPMDSLYSVFHTYQDKAILETDLTSYFKYLNSREYHQYDYGSYLIGDFRLDDFRGADVLSIYWYNRNLRIFRKLQDITEGGRDRILLIFGNGHASLLRQFIECSPEYEFVEFSSLEN